MKDVKYNSAVMTGSWRDGLDLLVDNEMAEPLYPSAILCVSRFCSGSTTEKSLEHTVQ